jgi:hypothetical protein
MISNSLLKSFINAAQPKQCRSCCLCVQKHSQLTQAPSCNFLLLASLQYFHPSLAKRSAAMSPKAPCPDAATSGFFNKLMFRWINPVVKQAAQTGEVDLHHLPLPTEQTAEVAHDAFMRNWDAAVKAGQPKLRATLWKTFGKDLMIAGLFKLVWSVW